MRQQLLRSLRRSQRPLSQANAARNLSSSARRAAEVELTIDGKKVSIEGTPCIVSNWPRLLTLTLAPSRLLSHSGLRKGRLHRPPLLLPRKAHDRRKLQNVSGRG